MMRSKWEISDAARSARLLRCAAVLTLGLSLQGCLAAAIPVLAGSALATRDVIEDGFAGSDKQRQESVEIARAPATQAQAPTAQAVTTPPITTTIPKEIVSEDGQRLTVLEMTDLPAPSGKSFSGSSRLAGNSFAGFASYAMQAAIPDAKGAEATSAILSNPGALDGERTGCGVKPAAVLIDLDPEGGSIDLDASAAENRQFANLLETMRLQDITIGWISGRYADDASAIRNLLASSQLDPIGQDTLLLMRYADDRKQTRRREFAEDYCLIAIAGDERSDFDELYEYLKDPDQALALEPIFGSGWFLTPSPLIQE